MDVVAIGDSLAVGVGQSMQIETHAKVGASSCWIYHHLPSDSYDTAIISAGVNDGDSKHCITEIRKSVKAKRVIWILPAAYATDEVYAVAKKWGDTVVSYTTGKGKTWPHPPQYDYRPLAHSIQEKL